MEWRVGFGYPPHYPLVRSLAHFCGSREIDSYYGQSAIYCRHSDEHWLLSAGFVLCIVDCGVALIAA